MNFSTNVSDMCNLSNMMTYEQMLVGKTLAQCHSMQIPYVIGLLPENGSKYLSFLSIFDYVIMKSF